MKGSDIAGGEDFNGTGQVQLRFLCDFLSVSVSVRVRCRI